MTGRGNRGFNLWAFMICLILVVSIFCFAFYAGPALASASLVPWSELDHDPADFSPVVSDSSGSLPGSESREAEGLAVSSETDEHKEEETDQDSREAEGLAVSSETDEHKEEKTDQEGREAEDLAVSSEIEQEKEEEAAEDSREAEGLAVSSEIEQEKEEEAAEDSREAEGLAVSSVTDSQQEELDDDSTDYISLTPSYFIGLSDDVSAIRSILETSSSEPMEAQEVGQDDENIDSVDTADSSTSSSSASTAVSSDASSSSEFEDEPATLDTIHSDLTILLFTLWGFAGLFLAFKIGGAVLGRL